MEHPVFTYETLNLSIADLIKEKYPTMNIYDSPVNAGKTLPRWFILYRGNAKFNHEVDRTGNKELQLDLVYEQDYNLVNLYDDYRTKAGVIEEAIHKELTYNIRNDKNKIIKKIPLDAHNIETYWDRAGMHCYFSLRLRIIDADVYEQIYIKTIDWIVKKKEHN